MPSDYDFHSWNVPELKNFLQERGISCSLSRKHELLRLCELAFELKLETLISPDDYEQMDEKRRTVVTDEDTVVVPELSKVTGWSACLKCLPDIDSCDTLIYLMRFCKWGEDRLRAYKNDNGYRLFLANHIDNVIISDILQGHFRYVKATCVPETRQTAKPYDVWVLIRDTGEILSGGCTCVADNGTCKHCVALLFGLGSFCTRHTDRNTEVGTDVTCVWDKPRQISKPMEIADIDVRSDPSLPPPVTPVHVDYKPSVQVLPADLDIEKKFKSMCKGSGALLLETLYESDDDENGNFIMLPTMSDVAKEVKPESTEDFIRELRNTFNCETIRDIEEATRGQSENPEWFSHRKGRVTASNFFSVMHFRSTDANENYISKRIMGKNTSVNSMSTSFGHDNEPIARQMYFNKYQQEHQKASLQLCGLFVDKDHPFLGASPDGIVKCKCCGEGLLEVKCSFMYKNQTPQEACADNHYHVYLDENDDVRLKPGTSWYTQIQGQLGVCGKKWCDFILYTKKGFVVDRIYFDAEFYRHIVEKCTAFFDKYIMKSLMDDDHAH
ncbi:uncharacterized protein [Argopecten irradians]|uniref:uncharacterized protein n=1 Tax=Argopecten irradians TaxID=31199 RepID=UPI0037243052